MKDPKQFRERFKKWKEGTPIEEIYDNGRPTYFDSVELLASPMAKNWTNIKEEFKPSAKYVGAAYLNGKDDKDGDYNPRPITTGGAGYIHSGDVVKAAFNSAYRYAFGDLPVDTIRKRLYENINPHGYYHYLSRVHDAVVNNKKEKRRDSRLSTRDDLWAEYLLIPQEQRHHTIYKVKDSPYYPTVGIDKNAKYKTFDLDEDSREDLYDAVYHSKRLAYDNGHRKKHIDVPLNIGDNSLADHVIHQLGMHTVGRGVDPNRGEYMSYYDVWDLAPFGKDGGEDQSRGIGKPFNIYDRVYLSDYFDVNGSKIAPNKGDYYGGFIPEVEITVPKKYAKGKDDNELPEVVVTPTKLDNIRVALMRNIVPNNRVRKELYDYMDRPNGGRGFLPLNDKVDRFILLWNYSGRPKVKNMAKDRYGDWVSMTNSGKSRAYYSPYYNSMYLGDDDKGYVVLDELSHAYQYNSKNSKILKTAVPFEKSIHLVNNDIKDKYGRNGYQRIGNIEYNAHGLIQPSIDEYIFGYNDNSGVDDYGNIYNIPTKQFYDILEENIKWILNSFPKSKYPELYDPYSSYARGKDSGIYIKPSKRGTFTAAAKKRGMSVLSFASKVLNNPSNYSKAMRKKALFAKNASKFKH